MPTPTRILVSKSRDALTLSYPENLTHTLSAEYLRVFSPSAEVRGHGRGNEVLQYGKREVLLSSLQKSGNYALQITFDDGHDSGIYSWDYLYDLGANYQSRWAQYLEQLNQAGKSRQPDTQIVQIH